MIKTKRVVNGLGFTAIVLLALTMLTIVGTQFVSTVAAQVSPFPIPTPKPSPTPTPSPSATPIPGLILTNGYVSPTSGTNSTVFTYYVTYYDPNVMKPMAAYAVIDNAIHLMTIYTGSTSMGIYGYSTTLSPAAHTYYFMFIAVWTNYLVWIPNQLSGQGYSHANPPPLPTPSPHLLFLQACPSPSYQTQALQHLHLRLLPISHPQPTVTLTSTPIPHTPAQRLFQLTNRSPNARPTQTPAPTLNQSILRRYLLCHSPTSNPSPGQLMITVQTTVLPNPDCLN
jgi:hypothetical protein